MYCDISDESNKVISKYVMRGKNANDETKNFLCQTKIFDTGHITGHITSGHITGHITSGHITGHITSGHTTSGHITYGHITSGHITGHMTSGQTMIRVISRSSQSVSFYGTIRNSW